MPWKISLEHCKELLVHNGKILPPQFKGKKGKNYLAVDFNTQCSWFGWNCMPDVLLSFKGCKFSRIR